MANKQKLDLLLSTHYLYLLNVSANITSRQRSTDQKYNLLHEVILSLYGRLNDHCEYLSSDTDFKKYTTKYLKQFYTWSKNIKHNTKKDNALFTFQPTSEELATHNFYIDEMSDNNIEALIYLEAENVNKQTKMFLKDLLSNDIPIDKGLMVNKIKHAASTLSLSDRQIFDMYYLQDLNCLDIYLELKRTNTKPIGYHSILKRQKSVKQQIIDLLK
jgi:hypothetical protein